MGLSLRKGPKETLWHKSPTGLQCTAVQEDDEPRGRQGSTLAHVPLKAVPPNMG